MAAKDYTFAAGWKDIYLTKKTKPRKDGLHVMSTDRRPLNEQEILYVIENYLRMYCANNDTDEVTVTNDGKPIFKMILLDKKGGE
ncbi:MAG: hypothetical protein IJ724_01395 [Muribaculaceae bacterium]|nr:hypothetical protein [Muribaculaceae bacterium]